MDFKVKKYSINIPKMEYFTVLHSGSYGCGSIPIPKRIANLYMKETGQFWTRRNRTDSIMGKLVLENRDECDKAGVDVTIIDKKFEDCWDIHEYDGLETIQINEDKYKLKLINDLVNSYFKEPMSLNDSSCQRMYDIKSILSMKIENSDTYDSVEDFIKSFDKEQN